MILSSIDEIKKINILKFLITTSSILERYGEVSNIIKKDGFKISKKF